MPKHKRKPSLGSQFDADFRDEEGRVRGYVDVLEHYRPRGFSKLVREGQQIMRKLARGEAETFENEWKDEADTLLTDWARRVERHDYICFGPFEHNGSVGFYINTDSAIEDADLKIAAGDPVPKGFTGMLVEVTDHGNVTASIYSRGRKCRELFAVV